MSDGGIYHWEFVQPRMFQTMTLSNKRKQDSGQGVVSIQRQNLELPDAYHVVALGIEVKYPLSFHLRPVTYSSKGIASCNWTTSLAGGDSIVAH